MIKSNNSSWHVLVKKDTILCNDSQQCYFYLTDSDHFSSVFMHDLMKLFSYDTAFPLLKDLASVNAMKIACVDSGGHACIRNLIPIQTTHNFFTEKYQENVHPGFSI